MTGLGMPEVYGKVDAVNSPQHGNLASFLGLPGAFWPTPIDAFQQHRELGAGEMHAALGGVRPDEAAAFQALGKQAQSITVPPQQFDQIATSATEDKDVPTKGIGSQVLLHDRRQTIEATAHVCYAGGQPDTCACR